jgi:3-dehydroquinate dehydratase-2
MSEAAIGSGGSPVKIYVINGPNLNLLGTREPDVYGTKTLEDVNAEITKRFPDCEFVFFQSNCEGAIIDKLHEARGARGVVLNPGALTHYSYAIRDAIAAIGVPVVEMHITNIYKREEFRSKSVISEVCAHVICGKGTAGYLMAAEYLIGGKAWV